MRKAIIFLVVLAAVAAAAVAVAFYNFESWLNGNREMIAEKAAEAIGRPVRFESVGVSLRGGLGVRVTGLAVADDPDLGEADLFAMDEARVNIKIAPALRGSFEIGSVTLVRPTVNVVRTAAGLNITALAGGESEEAEETGAAPAALVALMNIDDGRITYTDRRLDPPVSTEVHSIDCRASDLSMTTPMSFSLSAAVLGSESANVEIRGELGPVADVSTDDIPVRFELETRPIAAAQALSIYEALSGTPPGVQIDGPVSMEAGIDGTPGTYTMTARFTASDARVQIPGSLDKSPGVPMVAKMNGSARGERINVEQASFQIRDAVVNAHGTVETGEEGSTYSLQITGEPADLSGWEDTLPALAGINIAGTVEPNLSVAGATADDLPVVDGTITIAELSVRSLDMPDVDGLSTTVFVKDRSITIPSTTFNLNDAPVTAEVRVEDFTTSAATFAMTAPVLRLEQPSQSRPNDEVDNDELRDVRVAGDYRPERQPVQLKARLESGAGIVSGISYRDLDAVVRLENGRYVLSPLVMQSFGGTLEGEGFYVPGDTKRSEFNFEATAKGVDVGALLATGVGGAGHVLDGRLDAKLSLAGNGDEWEQIRDALVGGGNLEIKRGMLKDVNIADSLLQQLTGVAGLSNLISPEVKQRHPKLFKGTDTQFNDIVGEFSIAQGKLNSRDLTLHAADYSLYGQAGIGLDKSVDIAATFEASEALTASLISQLDAARYLRGRSGRIQIPFRLRGFVPDVRPEPDMAFVRNALGKAVVQGIAEGLFRPREKKTAPAAEPAKTKQKKTEPKNEKTKQQQNKKKKKAEEQG